MYEQKPAEVPLPKINFTPKLNTEKPLIIETQTRNQNLETKMKLEPVLIQLQQPDIDLEAMDLTYPWSKMYPKNILKPKLNHIE